MFRPSPLTSRDTSLYTNRKCLLICSTVAIANMQYGFDSAAIGALQAMPGFLAVFGYPDPSNPTGYGIDPVVQQLIASLLTLGSFLSSLLAGLFSHWFGRKQGLWLACALNVVSCIIMIATRSTGVLYLGRLLLGVSNGFLVTFSNVYTSEAAPAHLRGVIVALFAWWVNIGSLVGAIIVNYTRVWLDSRSYQIPIGCLLIVPVLLSVALWWVPESPRFLVNQGKEEAGKRALRTLRGNAVDEQGLELEWTEMIRGIEEERKNAKSVSFVDMFRGTDLRRTLLCYGMIACQTGECLIPPSTPAIHYLAAH
jgi:MFS family permease